MNWIIDDSIKSRDAFYNSKEQSYYYKVYIDEIYKKINDIVDNIEYCYAVLLLIKCFTNESKLYLTYSSKVYEGIKEYGLDKCVPLVDDKHKRVFIAMWFDDGMQGARCKIEKAVKDCGYNPVLIDVKEHNNQIVPEIFKEINDSNFVIADLTGSRGGVYYEASYAMAKEKPVILSCKDGQDTHFDVAQINTIFWKNEEDLYNRLRNRIKATVGENR